MATETAEMVDAEVVGAELVSHDAPPPALFKTDDPVEVIEKATAVANALKSVLDRQGLVQKIEGRAKVNGQWTTVTREHVKVEGWTTLGAMLGITAMCVATSETEKGFRATVEAKTADGRIVGRADAVCTRDEKRWKDAEDYALLSMAQTRATSKALRGPLGFVVALAGFETTPAEEMSGVTQPSTLEPAGDVEKPLKPESRERVLAAIDGSGVNLDLILLAVGAADSDSITASQARKIRQLLDKAAES